VHDVHILASNHLAKVGVTLDIRAGLFQRGLEVALIDITDSDQFGSRVDIFKMASPHAAHANNSLSGDFIWAQGPLPSQNVPRNNLNTGRDGREGADESTPGKVVMLSHGMLPV
jgi:hypothetical protein